MIYPASKYPFHDSDLPEEIQRKAREHAVERSKQLLWKAMSRAAQEAQAWVDRLVKCESPIEQLALVDMMSLEDDLGYKITPQVLIKLKKAAYRADFLVVGSDLDGVEKRVVVECDGHEFHEKTKEQAAKDKRRDRDLVAAGYIVLHFTGSEIYNNPGLVFSAVFATICGGDDGTIS